LIYHQEALFSFIISIFGADGAQMDITLVVLDRSPWDKCLSDTACSRIYDNHIFLDINNFYKRDKCGNNPLVHELLHFKYLGINTHDRCYLRL